MRKSPPRRHPPTHRPQPTNLSSAEKAAADDDGGGGGGAAAIHARISIRLMEQYRTYILYYMIIYIGRDIRIRIVHHIYFDKRMLYILYLHFWRHSFRNPSRLWLELKTNTL